MLWWCEVGVLWWCEVMCCVVVCRVQGKVYSGQESLPEVLELASKIYLKLVLLTCDCMTHTHSSQQMYISGVCVWKSNDVVVVSSLSLMSESCGQVQM